MSTFLPKDNLDFDLIKENLKNYLKNQEIFKDWNFEGSNLSVLLDLLASNTELLAYYLNMVASEQFLDTARLRENVVSHAKELNYVPRSKGSAIVMAKLIVEPHDFPSQIFVPKNYAIRTTYDSATYTFLLPNEAIIKNNNGVYESEWLEFYEGVLVTEEFDGGQSYYPLSSENIDISSIEVYVDGIEYQRAETLFGLNPESEIFFVEGYGKNQYQIVFGNDLFGKRPKVGQVIRVVYRDTVGSKANGLRNFSATDPIQGYPNVNVIIEAPSYGGAEEETLEDIKYHATRHFQLRNRAVTAEDYKTFVLEKFPQIQSVAAYGGEDVWPPIYGKVIIALKPYGSYATVTDRLKNAIKNFLSDKNITSEPVIVDPEYINIGIDAEIQCDLKKVENFEDVKSKVENAIINLNNTDLSDFGKDLRYSRLLSVIDNAHEAIVSNETKLKLIKKWYPVRFQPYELQFSFLNEIGYHINSHELLPEDEGNIYSTYFDAVVDNVTYTGAFIKDDGKGNIDLLQNINNNIFVVKRKIGKIDYETGNVYVSLVVQDYDNVIKIYAKPRKADIIAKNNMYLIIEGDDVNVNVVEMRT